MRYHVIPFHSPAMSELCRFLKIHDRMSNDAGMPLRVQDLEARNEWRDAVGPPHVAFHQHVAYIASLSSKASFFKPDIDTGHLESALCEEEALGCVERLSESSAFALPCALSSSLLRMQARRSSLAI
jgi:hypothetical protein